MKTITGIPAIWSDDLWTRPIQKQVSCRINKSHPQVHPNFFWKFFGNSNGLEHPHRFIIKMNRTGQLINLCFTFKNNYLKSAQSQEICQCRSCWSVTYDGTVIKGGRIFINHIHSKTCLGNPWEIDRKDFFESLFLRKLTKEPRAFRKLGRSLPICCSIQTHIS